MTVAHLKDRMDARFKTVDTRFEAVDKRFDQLTVRMDVGFRTLHDKLNAILRILDDKYKHHHEILDNHEDRLNDLEARQRSTRNIPG